MNEIGIKEDHTSAPVKADRSSSGSSTSQTTEHRNNNFNLLRLILATLVLLSHSPELVDGNRHREILTSIFGTISFGELAVDGFFLLSGFLIVQSWQRNPNLLDFFKKRILRIYPGFMVAGAISALIVGPLGADASRYFAVFNLQQFIEGTLFLFPPIVPPVFQGQPYPVVNGSMWTIAYEFRCYLFVGILGICGVVSRRYLWLALSGGVFILSLLPDITKQFSAGTYQFLFGEIVYLTHFLAFFCAGGCFYLFREYIRYKTRWLITAGIILLVCMFEIQAAQIALATAGAYLLFWFAFAPISALEKFRTYPDISYGVYLYGWPIQKLLLWYIPSLSPWVLFVFTFVLSCICGLLSWNLIEKPFMRLKGGKRERKEPAPIGGVNVVGASG